MMFNAAWVLNKKPKLEESSPKEEKEKTDEGIDPRWNTLKKLLTDK